MTRYLKRSESDAGSGSRHLFLDSRAAAPHLLLLLQVLLQSLGDPHFGLLVDLWQSYPSRPSLADGSSGVSQVLLVSVVFNLDTAEKSTGCSIRSITHQSFDRCNQLVVNFMTDFGTN